MSHKNQTGAAKSAAPITDKKKAGRTTATTANPSKVVANQKETSERETQAMKIAVQLGVKTLYENELGEYFTAQDRALLSVARDPKKIITYDFTGAKQVAETEEDAGTPEVAENVGGEGEEDPKGDVTTVITPGADEGAE